MTAMYLYANGCSMTYGSELHDDPVTKMCTNSSYRWERSWPGELGRLLGAAGVCNEAVPSSSNDRVARTTVEFVTRRWLAAGLPASQLLVVIGWSHPARREFFVDGAFRQVVPHHGYDLPGLDRLTRVYRRVACDDTEAQSRFATQSLTLAGFLANLGVRFTFFDAVVPNELPAALSGEPVTRDLLGPGRYLRPAGPDSSMAGVLRGDQRNWTGQHPSEAGHAVWADLLAEHLGTGQTGTLPDGPDRDALEAAGLPRLGGTGPLRRHDVKEADRTGMRPGLRPVARCLVPLRRRAATAVRRDPFLYP
jgi:Family of unknown function (DUF6071)